MHTCYFIYSIINDDYDYDCNEVCISDADWIKGKEKWVTPYTRCNTDWIRMQSVSEIIHYHIRLKLRILEILSEKLRRIVLGLPVTAMLN